MNEERRSGLEELEADEKKLKKLRQKRMAGNEAKDYTLTDLGYRSYDFEAFAATTDAAVLYLDLEFRIIRFTPAAAKLFNISVADFGTHLSEDHLRLSYHNLRADIANVISVRLPIEREIQDFGNRWYLTRIFPRRDREDSIDGIVLSFREITGRRDLERVRRRNRPSGATELIALQRLHEVTSRLALSPSLKDALDQVLIAAIEVSEADMGNVLLYEPTKNVLEITAQHGFQSGFFQLYGKVPIDVTSACGRCILESQRVVVEDVSADPLYEIHRDIAQLAGYRGVQATPLKSRSGEILGVLATYYRKTGVLCERSLQVLDLYARQAADFIERIRIEEHQQLLLRELDHRVKNGLAMALSIAKQTLAHSRSSEHFQEAFVGRIQALTEVHRLFTSHCWKCVSLHELVKAVVKPFSHPEGPVVKLRGKPLQLGTKISQPLYLVLHELATNAAKYGALSVSGGELEISWDCNEEKAIPELTIEWAETGGPALVAPIHPGFGTKLIERLLRYEGEGSVEMHYLSGGLSCRITVSNPQPCSPLIKKF